MVYYIKSEVCRLKDNRINYDLERNCAAMPSAI